MSQSFCFARKERTTFAAELRRGQIVYLTLGTNILESRAALLTKSRIGQVFILALRALHRCSLPQLHCVFNTNIMDGRLIAQAAVDGIGIGKVRPRHELIWGEGL